eukprot:jgi/Tetstr1/423733/TSEL_014366.t1
MARLPPSTIQQAQQVVGALRLPSIRVFLRTTVSAAPGRPASVATATSFRDCPSLRPVICLQRQGVFAVNPS